MNGKAKSKKHINIPVFIPHLGCPNMCVFCNQRTISGTMEFKACDVRNIIDSVLTTVREDTEKEIAFFGGSFTGIDRDLMIGLLDIADEYVKNGDVSGIRLSTRPDYIDGEILGILKRYPVKTIELGIQTMSDDVLDKCKRGHTSSRSVSAAKEIKEYGFDFVGQMMIGLPGSDAKSEIDTAEAICRMGADGARIYPLVIFKQTELEEMTRSGSYTELSYEETVERSKEVLKVFNKNNVPVIRIGLCASDNLADESMVYGGANQSAIGEAVMGEVYYDSMRSLIVENHINNGNVVFEVPDGEISKAVGQNRKNINRLKENYGLDKIKVVSSSELACYRVRLKHYTPQRRYSDCT